MSNNRIFLAFAVFNPVSLLLLAAVLMAIYAILLASLVAVAILAATRDFGLTLKKHLHPDFVLAIHRLNLRLESS